MGLQKLTKLRQQEGGFTIVELLIVIVVIGILAAITIVAYNGITAKANSANARSNAESVQKVAESFNADRTTGYPSDVASLIAYGGTAGDSSQLPSALKAAASGASGVLNGTTNGIIAGVTASICGTSTSITATCLNATYGTKSIIYVPKGTTGACIGYFDFGTATTLWIFAGNASTPAVTGSSPTATISCT